MFLFASPSAASSVLIKDNEGVQKPVNYISKAYQGAEIRYSRLEKLALVLALASIARHLRHYFQSHTIIVVTNLPVKRFLGKPDVSGRLLKWAVEQGEFDVLYQPRVAIKAQALADFVAELTPVEKEFSEPLTSPPDIQEASSGV